MVAVKRLPVLHHSANYILIISIGIVDPFRLIWWRIQLRKLPVHMKRISVTESFSFDVFFVFRGNLIAFISRFIP